MRVKILKDRNTGRMNGCAFIEYSTPEPCVEAKTQLRGVSLLGRPLSIAFCMDKKDRKIRTEKKQKNKFDYFNLSDAQIRKRKQNLGYRVDSNDQSDRYIGNVCICRNS